MKHSLAGKHRYLEDGDIARDIVDGTYEIPPELDEVTKYILQEIGNISREKTQMWRPTRDHHYHRGVSNLLEES